MIGPLSRILRTKHVVFLFQSTDDEGVSSDEDVVKKEKLKKSFTDESEESDDEDLFDEAKTKKKEIDAEDEDMKSDSEGESEEEQPKVIEAVLIDLLHTVFVFKPLVDNAIGMKFFTIFLYLIINVAILKDEWKLAFTV